MTPSTYIPITPATRIPFPCWLWDTTEPARWVSYHKPICGDYRAESSCFIEFGFTHYCTSATEPTGRPGEETLQALPENLLRQEKITSVLWGFAYDLQNEAHDVRDADGTTVSSQALGRALEIILAVYGDKPVSIQ
jgi:hypothetical protein